MEETSAICSPRWRRIKLYLTLTSIVASVVLLILGIVIAVGDFPSKRSAAPFCIALPIFAAIWDASSLIVTRVHKSKNALRHGIHPGAHVGVDLIVWLGALVCLLFVVAMCAYNRSYYRRCLDPAFKDYGDGFRGSFYCPPEEVAAFISGAFYRLLAAASAFIALLL